MHILDKMNQFKNVMNIKTFMILSIFYFIFLLA